MNRLSGSFIYNLLLFGRLLHGLGLDVDTGRMIDLVQALKWIRIRRKDDLFYAMRCLLVHNHEDLALFDRAFDLFWKKHSNGQAGLALRVQGSLRPRRPAVISPPLKLPDELNAPPPNERSLNDDPPVIEATLTYSYQEVLRKKDFAELDADELRAVQRMIASFDWLPGLRWTRRFEPGRGPLFDLRRTLRRNLNYGGEIFAWSRKEPKCKPRPLVILADISGSMERYTRMLLHFAYSIRKGYRQGGETFVFSTRLTRISRLLRERNVNKALHQISARVPDWSGGTRIGEALKAFNYAWGRRVLGHGALVLLISDGWDQGDAHLLRAEIARLQRSCFRLIWLNPLLGSSTYEPLTRGMQTALPYIDDFLPVHNLASLEDLAMHLRQVGEKDTPRRQVSTRFQGGER